MEVNLINNKILNAIIYLKELAEQFKLLDDRFVQYSLWRLSRWWDSGLANRLYIYLVNNMDSSALFDDDFKLPCWEDLSGEMILGEVIGNDTLFRISKDDVPKHILAMGTSGSGKTNFGLILAEQALLNGVRSIRISDPKADEFEVLAKKYPEFMMLRWSDLKFNPFTPPPNVPLNEWYQTVVNHMAQAFNFWIGSQSMFLKLMSKAYRENSKPQIKDVLRLLEEENPRYKQKDFMIMSTVASRLELMQVTIGEVISAETSMLEQLSKSKFILSTSGMMSEIESWLLEFLFIWEYLYRVFNPDKRELTMHFYDECQHRLFSSEKERNIKKISSSQISMLVDESRAMNIGICSMSQEPSSLVKPVLNNSFLKVAFHLGSGDEISTASNAMGLSEEQRQALHYLDTGEAIVRMAGGFMEPFPVKIQRFEERAEINDDEFWQHQKEMKERLYKDSGVVEGGKAGQRDGDGRDREDNEDSDWETYDVL